LGEALQLELSVILPVYNEEECIRAVIAELDLVLEGLAIQSEIVAVDDGSTDATAEILTELAGEIPRLRVVLHPQNAGQSEAFGTGFRSARGQLMITMDADGQNDPADIPRLLEALPGFDCVAGYRAGRRDGLSKRWGSWLANAVRNAVLGEKIIDTGCSLKLFRSGLVRGLEVWDGFHRFFPSLFLLQGARLRQVAVNHRARRTGSSKYGNLSRLVKTVPHLFFVRRMKRHQQEAAQQGARGE